MYADNQRESGVAVPPEDQLTLAAETFRMLADPTRIGILWALTGGECSVNELAATVGRPASATSQHLARLRLGGAVVARRQGTTMLYSIASEHVARLVVDAVHDAEHHEPGVPPHHRAGSGESARSSAEES